MQVHKFGGGVLHDADGIRRMAEIIRARVTGSYSRDLLVVVSALGKMTNAFERLWSDWIRNRDFSLSYAAIRNFHEELAGNLFLDKSKGRKILNPFFDEIDSILKERPREFYDKAYDRLVCYGELLASRLVSAYLQTVSLENIWLDSRDMIRTDSCFREAKVDWAETKTRIKEKIQAVAGDRSPGAESYCFGLTQGFIGSDTEGNTTTLGREGSDFSAAIFAYAMNAEEVILWKDVPGVMTGDPASFKDVIKLNQISYLEAIELSYFGAKILHPNTIKPLQNQHIPLRIMPINNPEESGTRVIERPQIYDEIPVLIVKPNQVLFSIQPRDFSFIMEKALSSIFSVLARYDIRVNLLQHGAVSLSFCVDYNEQQINRLVSDLVKDFKVLYNTGLELVTVRHYSREAIDRLTRGRKIYVQQQSRKTARFVLS